MRAARAVGAVTLVDAAQSVGHLPLDVREIGCDFLAFSGHKMCGPTGIGALYGRAEILDAMPPWHGGGEMIVSVDSGKEHLQESAPPFRSRHAEHRRRNRSRRGDRLPRCESDARQFSSTTRSWRGYAIERLDELPGHARSRTAEERGALVGFVMDAAHPHDLTTFADQHGLALRGGHHCNQPLMRRFGVPGTTRASFYFYNTMEEIDRMIEILREAARFFS